MGNVEQRKRTPRTTQRGRTRKFAIQPGLSKRLIKLCEDSNIPKSARIAYVCEETSRKKTDGKSVVPDRKPWLPRPGICAPMLPVPGGRQLVSPASRQRNFRFRDRPMTMRLRKEKPGRKPEYSNIFHRYRASSNG